MNEKTVRRPDTGVAVKKKRKTENASPVGEELRALLSQYGGLLTVADASYAEERERISEEKEKDLRRAAVDRAVLSRYADVGGEGRSASSQSAGIAEQNAYLRAVGGIEERYLDAERALSGQEARNRQSLMQHYGSVLRQDQDKLYDRTLEIIREEDWRGLDELRAILEQVRPYLRAEQMAHLDNVSRYYLGNPYFQGD